MSIDAAAMRRDYSRRPLDEAAVEPDPLAQFGRWFEEARGSGILEPNAMALATATADGKPSVRTVLLKGFDADGFVFYTSKISRKAAEMGASPYASLLFWWDRLERQVRIEGEVAPVADAEADAYFATRPRAARIAAWASSQSAVVEGGRAALEAEEARQAARFEGVEVPRPPFWGGYRLRPEAIELWQGRENRLHDRLRYRRDGDGWVIERLAP